MSVNGGREARPDTLITAPTRQPGEGPAATANNDQRRANAALMPPPRDGAASFFHLKKNNTSIRRIIRISCSFHFL